MGEIILLKISLIITLFYLLNIFFSKNNFFFENLSISHHKKFITPKKKQNYLGILFLITVVILEYNNLNLIFFILIFFLGLAADFNFISDVSKRFLILIVITTCFLLFSGLLIQDLRAEVLNNIIDNNYLKLIITTFCIMVFVNGSNFIDGVNLNSLIYFSSIILSLIMIEIMRDENLDLQNLYLIFFTLVYLSYLNFKKNVILGDSGIYLLSFYFCFLILSIHNNNLNFSPYFIALLFFYPAFENLFSIIRKFISKKNPLKPDNEHLHHLFYLFLKKKRISFKNINNLSGLLMSSFSGLLIIIGSLFYDKTSIQIVLILFFIIFYLFAYYFLKKESR